MMRSWPARKNLLVVASYIFYGAWNPPFAALLFATTAMDFYLGRIMGRQSTAGGPQGLAGDQRRGQPEHAGVLQVREFPAREFPMGRWRAAGIAYQPPHLDLFLPIGISFYTFHSLSYTLDIYRGVLKPTRSLRDFVLAVSFFPQLVAGPIVRAGDFLPQLEAPPKPQRGRFFWGLLLMTLGLFEKVVLADTLLAGSADTRLRLWRTARRARFLDGRDGVSRVRSFSISPATPSAQSARPYVSGSISRTTSGFPTPRSGSQISGGAGTSRSPLSCAITFTFRSAATVRGAARAMINLMIVMFIGGLWHGAAWTFVVWGLLHGSYLALERLTKVVRGRGELDGASSDKVASRPGDLLRRLCRVGFLSRARFHGRRADAERNVRRSPARRRAPLDPRDFADRNRDPRHVRRPLVAAGHDASSPPSTGCRSGL